MSQRPENFLCGSYEMHIYQKDRKKNFPVVLGFLLYFLSWFDNHKIWLPYPSGNARPVLILSYSWREALMGVDCWASITFPTSGRSLTETSHPQVCIEHNPQVGS